MRRLLCPQACLRLTAISPPVSTHAVALEVETSRIGFRSASLFLTIIALTALAPQRSIAQTPDSKVTGFVQRTFQDADGDHKYVLFVPSSYAPQKAQQWPLIVFLHGAFERGTDGQKPLEVGLGPALKKRARAFPCFVLFPQAEDVKGRIKTAWSSRSPDGRRVLAILDEVQRAYPIQANRTILTGWSMGGYGAWQLAAENPGRFSAVVPLAGGADAEIAAQLKGTPVWAFHGSDDDIVKPEETRAAVAALVQAGGTAEYTELPGVDHDTWRAVYENDALFDWMLNPSQANAARLRLKPGERRTWQVSPKQPFRPALEISNSLSVRLGNEALKAIAYTVPVVAPRSAMSGQIPDISDSTSVEGYDFNVQFTRIAYRTDLERAEIRGHGKDRLLIQLGLRNVSLVIGTTYVSGGSRSAVAGPITVSIGAQRPVWLNIFAAPTVSNRQLKLRVAGVQFEIPGDNWSVSQPAGVRTKGLGMTEERVSGGLTRGIYGQKGRIEREVRAVVPAMLAELEKRLDLSQSKAVVEGLWPLPVYRPQMEVWPANVFADQDGLTVHLGLSVASIDPRNTPKVAERIALPASGSTEIGGTKLSVTVAPQVLNPLSGLLIREDLARIHCADIPGNAFLPFLDRKALAAAIPDVAALPDDVELSGELILNKPLAAESSGEDSAGLNLGLPQLTISTAYRRPGAKASWTPYAELEFQVDQPTAFRIGKPNFVTRALEFDWAKQPRISASGRFAAGYEPGTAGIDQAALQSLFSNCWQTWTQAQTSGSIPVRDVDFGFSKMRLQQLQSTPDGLAAVFGVPGVRITNLAKEPFEYQTKGPNSSWGQPYKLTPGSSHEFDIVFPLMYRRRTARGYESYTLPVGSHSEYRVPLAGGTPRLFQASDTVQR